MIILTCTDCGVPCDPVTEFLWGCAAVTCPVCTEERQAEYVREYGSEQKGGPAMSLVAPFPYYGGKRRWAPEIWKRFGAPDVYAEPFAGSLAVLLANPRPAKREVVCDKDGHICNFWRAMRGDPEQVAEHADWPTFHQDLTARHRWLRAWAREHAHELSEDPDYYSAKAAGWWVWGISNWIGSGWCTEAKSQPDEGEEYTGGDHIPIPSGRGVNQLRTQIKDVVDHVPLMPGGATNAGGGQGVTRTTRASGIPEKRPDVKAGAALAHAPRSDLIDWFNALADRLRKVVVLNRDWRSAVTPAVIADNATSPDMNRCILLDPPYLTEKRSTIYSSDLKGTSDNAAAASYEWAIEHGDRYRIAYCSHEHDFPAPVGWESMTRGFMGPTVGRAGTTDMVMFSPACTQEAVQEQLF